jgi:hypothetical protein
MSHLKIKDEFQGMILSRFDLELGLRITLYPDIDPIYYKNFQDRGFNIFEEVKRKPRKPKTKKSKNGK